MTTRKTLILAAHPDDETLSCGGLIQNRLAQQGEVHVVSVFGRRYPCSSATPDAAWVASMEKKSRQGLHFRDAMRVFGIPDSQLGLWSLEEGEPYKHGYYGLLEPIEELLAKYEWDEVVIPSPSDLNQDHRHLHDVCKIALRPANLRSVRQILMWHGHDGGIPASANWFEPLTQQQQINKERATMCYKDESKDPPHPRCLENLYAYARLCGSIAGYELAEPFTLHLRR
jgi:LmbE family N-acetylglucosaminyl deacetylase